MAKFNFTPFSGDPLTHRIEYSYACGVHVSSPANYSTDIEAIQAAELHRNIATNVEVLKYCHSGSGLVSIYKN